MNDRYFVALGWVGLSLAVVVGAVECAGWWVRDEWAMAKQVAAPYWKGRR